MSFDLDNLRQKVAQHGRVMRLIVLETKGSAPRPAGTEMLVWRDGQDGTIGGGTFEYQAIDKARNGAFCETIPLGPNLGQCCGGAVTLAAEEWTARDLDRIDQATCRRLKGQAPCPISIKSAMRAARNASGTADFLYQDGWLFERTYAPDTRLWIYGAGHVGRALINVMAPLPSIAITWVDTAADRFPASLPANVDQLVAADPAAAARFAPSDASHLIVTYSHAIDLALCNVLAAQQSRFVGLIGSNTKWARFRSRLSDLGHTPANIARITCPIGTPDLGKHPQQIAVGVAHQLTQLWAAAPSTMEMTA